MLRGCKLVEVHSLSFANDARCANLDERFPYVGSLAYVEKTLWAEEEGGLSDVKKKEQGLCDDGAVEVDRILVMAGFEVERQRVCYLAALCR